MANLKKSRAEVNVGVDMGKASLDVFLHEKNLHWQEKNTEQDINRFLKRLAHYKVERLVMEATGQ